MNFISGLQGKKDKATVIKFSTSETLGLLPSQILYVEDKYNRFINGYIQKEYHQICHRFSLQHTEFIYLPSILEELSTGKEEVKAMLHYFFPYVSSQYEFPDDLFTNDKRTSASHAKQLFAALHYTGKIRPGFLRIKGDSVEYYPLNAWGKKAIIEIDAYIDKEAPVSPLYFEDFRMVCETREEHCLMTTKDSKSIAPYYEEDVEKYNYRLAIGKIRNYIKELKKLGYNEVPIQEIERLIREEDIKRHELTISRLVMDSEYKIYLPDYGNMEIRMTTLPKTLFILFVQHPEGIVLKRLSDYEPELIKIYTSISNRENITEMYDSIKRLCTPLDPSLHEKLSRIREAFLRNMADKYAKHYYVCGDRGEKMQIRIDRALVSLPEEFTKAS